MYSYIFTCEATANEIELGAQLKLALVYDELKTYGNSISLEKMPIMNYGENKVFMNLSKILKCIDLFNN